MTQRSNGTPGAGAGHPTSPPRGLRSVSDDNFFRYEDMQRVLDTAGPLQAHRTRIVERMARGEPVQSRMIGVGPVEIAANMKTESLRWKSLRSVRPCASVAELRASMPQNRLILSRGLQMTSLFDFRGTDPGALTMLYSEAVGDYRIAKAPVQMKIIDGREVLLGGPAIDGLPTVMAVTDPACLAAAWAYWKAALATSFPATDLCPADIEPTDRQRQVVALLATDVTDAQIAVALGVSVRTVRADIAQLMAATGARSRFSLGRVITTD